LFKEYGINVIIKDKGIDKETINAKVLEPQADQFRILPVYLKFKALQKVISTYGYNWEKFINSDTRRIHTTFKQLMDTGRLSCGSKWDNTPNLQNIPSDEETRSCFIPAEGNVMIDADYSSQEQIILANFSKEENLLNFYNKGFNDMHSYVAFLMYPAIRQCEVEELTPESLKYIPKEFSANRKLAKNAGFAINYGGNGSTIAKNCNISARDGAYVYDSYFKAFPGLKNYFEYMFSKTDKHKYVEFNKVTRRKYIFPETNDYFTFKDEVEDPFFWQTAADARSKNGKYNKAKSDIQRLCQNYPIQGTAADITKYACILFFQKILKNDWWGKVLIPNLVHDELLVECPKSMASVVAKEVVTCMEKAGEPFCKIIPLRAEAIIGDHWVH
jgi:DNA polymerase-1